MYLAVFLGCLIYVLLQLNGVFALPEFKWTVFVKTNIVQTILNLVIGCSLVFVKDDLVNIYPITFFSALMLGISGQALIKKLSDAFDKNLPTVIGKNG